MNDAEFMLLDQLLDKLRTKIGRYVIHPCHMGEMRLIGLYDREGNLVDQVVGPTVKDAVESLDKTP